MIWFFHRGPEVLWLETRFDNERQEFVLRVFWADSPVEEQRFAEERNFEVRLRELEGRLTADHWVQSGSPQILPEGWKLW